VACSHDPPCGGGRPGGARRRVLRGRGRLGRRPARRGPDRRPAGDAAERRLHGPPARTDPGRSRRPRRATAADGLERGRPDRAARHRHGAARGRTWPLRRRGQLPRRRFVDLGDPTGLVRAHDARAADGRHPGDAGVRAGRRLRSVARRRDHRRRERSRDDPGGRRGGAPRPGRDARHRGRTAAGRPAATAVGARWGGP
ncbi:MAG: hypothetical protein AVDCRST_MAG79-1720, partial [uncultured Thermoleophilia bacterium]